MSSLKPLAWTERFCKLFAALKRGTGNDPRRLKLLYQNYDNFRIMTINMYAMRNMLEEKMLRSAKKVLPQVYREFPVSLKEYDAKYATSVIDAIVSIDIDELLKGIDTEKINRVTNYEVIKEDKPVTQTDASNRRKRTYDEEFDPRSHDAARKVLGLIRYLRDRLSE